MSTTINLGKVGITTEGEYISSKAYDRLSCVSYNGESWVSTKDVPVGSVPYVNSEYWQQMSSRGEKGDTGEVGPQGIQGVQGPQGNSGYQGAAGELKVVNNLTEGGETAALSAEQGKVLKQDITELSAELGKKQDTITDLETIRSGAEKGATAIQEVKTINGQSIVGSGNIEIQGGGGGNSHWVLRETHTFDGVNGTITYSDLPMEFLALLDYNGTIDVAKKVTFQVGQPELMRAAYDFAASRQMHIGFHLTSDGVITNIVSHSSEWNNKDAATPKILYSSIVLPQAFKLIVYANSIIPEGTTIKIYTR